jgi:hypothetical protein
MIELKDYEEALRKIGYHSNHVGTNKHTGRLFRIFSNGTTDICVEEV